MKDTQKAFDLAKAAAEIDFNQAVMGLIAGHAEELDRARKAYAEIDAAFLSALVLTNKGARLDPDGMLAKTICNGIKARSSLSNVERDFLVAHGGDNQ